MEQYGVAIVGCGPAGLRATRKLAEKDVRVIAFDKKQEIGVPVRCGEGLGCGWFQKLGLKPDRSWAVHEIYGAALWSPSGKKLEIRTKEVAGYILERRMFEKFLAREAALNGALIRVKSNVVDAKRKNGRVELKVNHLGEEQNYSASVIIAADGVDSLTARRLALDTANKLQDIDSGFQYEMAGVDFEDPDLIHLFFGNKLAPRGYCWIFPKGKHEANVGIGIGGFEEKTARYYLDRFIGNHRGLSNGSIIHVNAGAIPIGGFLDNMVKDNLVVVGDAAHQVDPIHGGGMGLAMEAADIVASVIAESVKKKDCSEKMLSKYNSLWYEKRGNSLKKRLKARHLAEDLTDSDMESLVDTMSGEDIMKIAEGELAVKARIATKLVTKHALMKKMLKHLR